MQRYRYSSWDGSSEPFLLHPDEVMDEISNDLFGDMGLERALQRIIQRGMESKNGRRTQGMRDLMERLRSRRREQMEKYDLGSVLNDIKERLQDIVQTEREGIRNRLNKARDEAKQDPAKQPGLDTLEKLAEKRREALKNLTHDPAEQIKALSNYDFMDPEARRKFQELLDELKKRAMDQHFKNMQQSLQNMSGDQMQAMKQLLKDLNQLFQQHRQGKLSQEQFNQFMQQYGGMFGDRPPQNMQELAERLQERMAQAQSLLDSMPEATRQQLQDLMDAMMDDEMRQQMSQLAQMLDELAPMDDLRREYPFTGDEELSMQEAMRLMEEFQKMDNLEQALRDVRSAQDLERVDAEAMEEILGEDARRSLEELKDLLRKLEEAGYIRRKGDRYELTPQGVRKIGQKAIREIFSALKKDRVGSHEIRKRGGGGEPSGETKPWEFGDDFNVDLRKTLLNSVKREGAGTPLRMRVSDFEVERIDFATQAATCLLIDRSRSMGYYGNFAAAKKVAIALHTLIRSKFPRDVLYIIGFSDVATQFKDADLPDLYWDTGISGTNMHHAFMLARKLLSKHKGATRQAIMITDGEPTAHLEQGVPYFSYPPSPRTISETLKEVRRCTQEHIVINTFMLENNYQLVDFVNLLTRINHGRAFYASPDKLGEYVLVDFLSNRRRKVA
jgi:uncharacterized protein with von Willebrand factor type A (vWA) domain